MKSEWWEQNRMTRGTTRSELSIKIYEEKEGGKGKKPKYGYKREEKVDDREPWRDVFRRISSVTSLVRKKKHEKFFFRFDGWCPSGRNDRCNSLEWFHPFLLIEEAIQCGTSGDIDEVLSDRVCLHSLPQRKRRCGFNNCSSSFSVYFIVFLFLFGEKSRSPQSDSSWKKPRENKWTRLNNKKEKKKKHARTGCERTHFGLLRPSGPSACRSKWKMIPFFPRSSGGGGERPPRPRHRPNENLRIVRTRLAQNEPIYEKNKNCARMRSALVCAVVGPFPSQISSMGKKWWTI